MQSDGRLLELQVLPTLARRPAAVGGISAGLQQLVRALTGTTSRALQYLPLEKLPGAQLGGPAQAAMYAAAMLLLLLTCTHLCWPKRAKSKHKAS